MQTTPDTTEPVVTHTIIKGNGLQENLIVRPANASDAQYAEAITSETASSAIARGTGIARRPVSSVILKMLQGKAVIALTESGNWAGFAYLETWDNGLFVSNSGLIVSPQYRNRGIAAVIKQKIFQLSRSLYPNAKIFSITTSAAVMKMNTRLGFEPVTYNAITRAPAFWENCKSCTNYHILSSKDQQNCLCTALHFDPLSC